MKRIRAISMMRVNEAAGLKAGDEATARDPFVASQGFSGALSNLMAALTGPAMPAAIQMLNGLSGGLNSVAATLAGNPAIAKMTGLGAAAGVGVIGTGAAVGALKGALPCGSGLIGGGLIGAGRALPQLARGAGFAGMAYGAYQGFDAALTVAGGIGYYASGGNYTPADAGAVFDLASQLRDLSSQIAGIKERTWPAPIRWPGSNLMHGGLGGHG